MERFLVLLFLFASCVLSAQVTGHIQFIHSYGGQLSEGGAGGFCFSKDGNILYGSTSGSTSHDLSCNTSSSAVGWLLKVDKNLSEVFSICNKATVNTLAPTRDSGCIVGGLNGTCYDSTGGLYNLSLIKYDKSGSVQWNRCYGGGQDDGIVSIDCTADGGYIFLAQVRSTGGQVGINYGGSDAWLVKVDSTGDIQWKEVLGGSSSDVPTKVKEVSAGKYLTLISTESVDHDLSSLIHYYNNQNTGRDEWICMFDSLGHIIRQSMLPWFGSKFMTDFIKTGDGSFLLSGWIAKESRSPQINTYCTTNDSVGGDFAIFKLDSLFNIQWCWTEGGSFDDVLNSITAISDTTFLAIGYSNSADYNASSLCVVNPTTNNISEGWMFCIDIGGHVLWKKCFSGSMEVGLNCTLYDSLYNQIYLSGGGQATDGDLAGVPNYGEADEWIMKMDIVPTGISQITMQEFSIYPNPTFDNVTIKMNSDERIPAMISVSDMMGQQIIETPYDYPQSDISLKPLTPGVYILKIQSPEFSITRKIIKR